MLLDTERRGIVEQIFEDCGYPDILGTMNQEIKDKQYALETYLKSIKSEGAEQAGAEVAGELAEFYGAVEFLETLKTEYRYSDGGDDY